MSNSQKALFYGLAAVAIWSTVASAFKISLNHLDPLQLLLCACSASIIALTGVLAFQSKLSKLQRRPRKEVVQNGLLGVLNPFLYYVVLFKAYDLLPAQEAQPINYTWAITLSLLSIPLLGQKMSFKDLFAILTSYFGVVIISTHGNVIDLHFSNGIGVLLALGSTVIWALYWIFNTKNKTDPMVGLFLNFLCGFPFILAATLIFSELPPLNWKAMACAAYVGFFEMGISFALWLTAMKCAAKPDGGGTTRVANLIFMSPFLSLVFIHFLLGETILPTTVIGLCFIIVGNILMQFKRNAPKQQPSHQRR